MKTIINNKEISFDVANTFYKRFIGLMGQKKITKGLLIPKCKSIHTFFMKTNIDIIMLDKNYKVIFFKNVSKNKIIIKKEAYYVLELPSNSINNIYIGNKLIFYD